MVKIREVFGLKVKGEGNGIGLCWQVILEIRKEEDYISPVWIVLGSSLGGLLLLAILVLALWKVRTNTHTHRLKESGADECQTLFLSSASSVDEG